MKVGMVGLGKLGFPCALAMEMQGHEVWGNDIDPRAMSLEPRKYEEAGPDGTGHINDLIQGSKMRFGTVEDLVKNCELIFVAVQTPHQPQYEGITPIPRTRADFDYRHLKDAISKITAETKLYGKSIPIVVISTCLPGTMREHIEPFFEGNPAKLVYNPYFIAMTTTMRDFLNPEFILLGSEDEDALNKVRFFYANTLPAPIVEMGIGEAELTKVAYNTFIGFKLIFVNALMEICDRMGLNVDSVTEALCMAKERLISDKYMTAGMGDGGGCHPRDQIALSWLARELNLSHDIFEDVMLARENQAKYLCDKVRFYCRKYNLSPFILGTSYKPGTKLDIGSPARLCQNILGCQSWDPYQDEPKDIFAVPRVYLIGCAHGELFEDKLTLARGSVVIDPWRRFPEQEGVRVIHVGA